MRDDGLVDGHGRGVHLLGLYELHISSADGLTFFVLVLAQERSVQFRASISREFFFQRFQWGVRTAPLHGTHASPRCRRHGHWLLLREAYLCVAWSSHETVISQDFGLCASRWKKSSAARGSGCEVTVPVGK